MPVQKTISIITCCLLGLLLLLSSTTLARDIPRVVIVHSYDAENFVTVPQDRGIVAGLAAQGFVDGKTVEILRYYMDTKRSYTSPEQIKARGAAALTWVRIQQPDLVFTVDDNAVRTVMLPLVDTDMPVVFSGMNTNPAVYNQRHRFMESRSQPGHNVTGIYEKLHLAKSVKVMREILPDLKKIIFIVDDSPTGDAIKRQMEDELFQKPDSLVYTIRQVHSFDEYKQLIRLINADDDVGAYCPVAVRLSTADGGVIANLDLFRWTLAHARKPDMAVNYFMCRLGAFGGVSVDFQAMGRQAGMKGAAILKGASPRTMAIEDAIAHALVFNIVRARQLFITIPADLLGAADHVYEKMQLEVIPHPLRLLIVRSFPENAGITKPLENGLLRVLARNGYIAGKSMEVERLLLTSHQRPVPASIDTVSGSEALAFIKAHDPDLVITLQDAATREVMLPLVDSPYSVLFGGTRIAPETYNQLRLFLESREHPGHNVSGVTSGFPYEKTLEAVLIAFPETKKIVLVVSMSATGMRKELEKGVRAFTASHPRVSVLVKSVKTFDAFKKNMMQYNQDPTVDILTAFTPSGLLKADGSKQSLPETLAWLFAHSHKPGFAFCDNAIRYGYLLGTTIDCGVVGEQLGEMATHVFDGINPGDLPVENPKVSHLAVNLARAEQLHVTLPVAFVEAAQQVFFEMKYQEAF